MLLLPLYYHYYYYDYDYNYCDYCYNYYHHHHRHEIVEHLSQRVVDVWQKEKKIRDIIPPCTAEELACSGIQIKTGKARGLTVYLLAVIIALEIVPEVFLNIINYVLIYQNYHKIWKIALIWKGKPPELSSSFRPICMLSVTEKFSKE